MTEQRTTQQNRAVHLWFTHIAKELNDAGFEQAITIGTVDVPWSEDSIKVLFKKIGRYQFNKGKTSQMTTKELTEVAETLNRFLAEKGYFIEGGLFNTNQKSGKQRTVV